MWSQEAPAHSFRGKTIQLPSVHLFLHNKWSPPAAHANTFLGEAFQLWPLQLFMQQCYSNWRFKAQSMRIKPSETIINIYKKNAGSLKKHMRQHSGEKPFACNQYSLTCTTLSSLRTHMYSHTGKKPYACKKCNYTCIQPFHLRRHMKKHQH